MNDFEQIENMLKERLVPAEMPAPEAARLRRIWRKPATAAAAGSESRLRLQMHVWQWAFAAAAACAAALVVLRLYQPQTTAANPAVTGNPAGAATEQQIASATPDTSPAIPATAPAETYRTVISAEDLGVVGTGEANARRQVRVRYMENERWPDRNGGGWIQRSLPREAIFQLPVGAAGVSPDGTLIQRGPDRVVPDDPAVEQ